MDPSCFPHWRGSRISRSTAASPKRRPKWAFPRRAVAKPEGAGKQLNLKLLHRTTRDMSLTEEGQRLLEALAPALNAIEHAVSTLEEPPRAGGAAADKRLAHGRQALYRTACRRIFGALSQTEA